MAHCVFPFTPSAEKIHPARDITSSIFHLPSELPHELNIARAADPKVRIETAVIGRGADGRAEIWRRLGEVRMIECIEKAGPKLESEAFSQLESSLNGYVECVQSRSYEGIAWAIAERPRCRLGERINRSVGLRKILKLVMNRADAVIAFVEVAHAAFIAKSQERRGQPVAQSCGSRELPVSCHITKRARGLGRGNRVHVGDNQGA